jgi:hypothetical protein
MYASCGWFFDDVAGLESALVLRMAAHVLDLWREVGAAQPPTGDLLDVLAQARSNEPRTGLATGADVLRRVARERMTPAVAVARTAFAALAASAAARDADPPPGFEVRLPSGNGLALAGLAQVVHGRSGAETTVDFTASYDGGSRFDFQAGDQRITLDDLDEGTGHPLRLEAIARFADRPVTVAHCRAALDLARALGPLSPTEAQALGARFADMLLGLLRSPPATPTEAVWELAGELLERADLGHHGDEAQLAEDLVWDIMGNYRDTKRTPPRGLRDLADRLRLAPDGEVGA